MGSFLYCLKDALVFGRLQLLVGVIRNGQKGDEGSGLSLCLVVLCQAGNVIENSHLKYLQISTKFHLLTLDEPFEFYYLTKLISIIYDF